MAVMNDTTTKASLSDLPAPGLGATASLSDPGGTASLCALDGWIDVARAGTWRDMEGRQVKLTAQTLAAIAADYAHADPAPVVVGHPKDDAPAYGWVDRLRVTGDRLQAKLCDIAPAFRDAVARGSYRGRSVALREGRLVHLGFLGGRAPAIPGLAPTRFSAPADSIIEFAAKDALDTALAASGEWRGWRVLARLLRSMRERIVASDGVEAADRALPDWQIEEVASLGQASLPGAALALEETGTAETDETDKPSGDENMTGESDGAADLAAREKALAEREAKLAADQAELTRSQAEAEVAARFARADTALEAHVQAGRVLPAERAGLAALLASLPVDDGAVIAFAAADGKTEKKAPGAVLEAFLSALPARVDYGRHAGRDSAPADGGDRGGGGDPAAIAAQATKHREAALAAGRTLTVAQAVDEVMSGAAQIKQGSGA